MKDKFTSISNEIDPFEKKTSNVSVYKSIQISVLEMIKKH
jgi:hypothetical protein